MYFIVTIDLARVATFALWFGPITLWRHPSVYSSSEEHLKMNTFALAFLQLVQAFRVTDSGTFRLRAPRLPPPTGARDPPWAVENDPGVESEVW